MFKGKRPVFDAFEAHADIVTELPAGAILLASNSYTDVQALDVRHGKGRFWAFQYHPEYDFAEIARLTSARQDGLIKQGSFRDQQSADEFSGDIQALHDNPSRPDQRWKWGVDEDLIDADFRALEVRNWLEYFFGT